IRAVEGESHERRRDDELDEALEEWLCAVRPLIALGERPSDVHELEPDELEAARLVPGEDAADQLALDAVGLDEDEGPFGAWHVFLGWSGLGRAGIVSDSHSRAWQLG